MEDYYLLGMKPEELGRLAGSTHRTLMETGNDTELESREYTSSFDTDLDEEYQAGTGISLIGYAAPELFEETG